MDFVKWTSIENSYRSEYIQKMVMTHPELIDCEYIITEKVDGSNFQWAISPEGTIRAGSRNQWIDINGSFRGASVNSLYNEHQPLLDDLSELARTENYEIRLYGELFGRGILNRVDYGNNKRLLYFGMMVDGELMTWEYLDYLFENLGYSNLLVPIIEFANCLEDAMSIQTEFNSLLSDKENNTVEGVVIAPYNKVFLNSDGSPFILKKKNEKFTDLDHEVMQLNAVFLSYITENRLLSLFTKEGKIETQNEIGKYIKLMLADAQEDFLKDNDLSTLDKQQQKSVFNVGSTIANMLKAHL